MVKIIFLIFSVALIHLILAQDGKDVLYGLPPLPLTADEQATSSTIGSTLAPTTLFIQRFFTLPKFTPPPLPRELPYIDTYGINPLPELPPQPESKYDGYFDDDGNFVPRVKPENETKSEEEEVPAFVKERISQIVKNQIFGAKLRTESTLVKRDLSLETTTSSSLADDKDLTTSLDPSPTSSPSEASQKSTVKNYDSAKEVLVVLNEDEGKDKSLVFDETSLKDTLLDGKEVKAEAIHLAEDPAKEEAPISVESHAHEDTSAVIIGKHVAADVPKALAGGRTLKKTPKGLQTSNERLPPMGTQVDDAKLQPHHPRIEPRPHPTHSKRRLRIHKRRKLAHRLVEVPEKTLSAKKQLEEAQFDVPIQQRTTVVNSAPRAKFFQGQKFIQVPISTISEARQGAQRRQNRPNTRPEGQRDSEIGLERQKLIQRTKTQRAGSSERFQRLQTTQRTPIHPTLVTRVTPSPFTSHVELPPLSLPKFRQKIAQNIHRLGQQQGPQGQLAQPWRPATTIQPLVTGTARVSKVRQRTRVPGKAQKPTDQFRDIPPVPQEDLAAVQKNFVRVAPTLPTPPAAAHPQSNAQVQQFQQQGFQQGFQQPQQQFVQQQQQFAAPVNRAPPPPVATTLPPPPRNHPIQWQPDNREPVVREYLRELENYDWHVHYAEQNINNFRGPFRSGGVQQSPQNGKQPSVDYLKELVDDEDLQSVIERRNHFAENPPQLHVDLPGTAPTPYYNLYTQAYTQPPQVNNVVTQEALVPLGRNVPAVPQPQTFVGQQVIAPQQGYGPRPAVGNPNAVQTGLLGITPHPILNYVHNLFGFQGPHPLGHLFG